MKKIDVRYYFQDDDLDQVRKAGLADTQISLPAGSPMPNAGDTIAVGPQDQGLEFVVKRRVFRFVDSHASLELHLAAHSQI